MFPFIDHENLLKKNKNKKKRGGGLWKMSSRTKPKSPNKVEAASLVLLTDLLKNINYSPQSQMWRNIHIFNAGHQQLHHKVNDTSWSIRVIPNTLNTCSLLPMNLATVSVTTMNQLMTSSRTPAIATSWVILFSGQTSTPKIKWQKTRNKVRTKFKNKERGNKPK